MSHTVRRLQQVQNILNGPLDTSGAGNSNSDVTISSEWKQVLVLPDDATVSMRAVNSSVMIAINNKPSLSYRSLPYEVALVLSALSTPYEKDSSHPKYAVLEFSAISDERLSVPDFWACIYGLWSVLHTQEHIPIVISNSTPHRSELTEYLLSTGLARRALDPSLQSLASLTAASTSSSSIASDTPLIFLLRDTFWQSAGTPPINSISPSRSWLQYPHPLFPSTPTFTRTPLVIASHLLRPPHPPAGIVIYKRYCIPVRQTLTLTVLDPENDVHMQAFHKWMNDPRVNKGWGEAGSMESHRAYVVKVSNDPVFTPIIMSWDGEPMGYAELVYIKENHVATYIPEGAWDHDRGLHVLVGEDKFRGQVYSQAWFRSLTHYLFLADPRTYRIVGEPKRANPAIIKTSLDAGMHLQTSFYFPYKHSVMTVNLRERFFKEDMLT